MIASFLSRMAPWTLVALTLTGVLLIAFSLAIFGIFFKPLVSLLLFVFALSFALAGYQLYTTKDFTRLFLLLALALFALVVMFQTEPSVFTGRDQGSIAIAAWELAKNGELAFRTGGSDEFFSIYGPGVALNFPGFSYTETGALLSQFPLGYTSYLALFVAAFGIAGYALANAALLVFSGWTFFEFLTLFLEKRLALIGTALFTFSFPLIWLTQITLTENLALPLFLILAFVVVRLERSPEPLFVALLLCAGFLLAMTRIEGFIIFPLAVAYALMRPHIRALIFSRPVLFIVVPLILGLFLFLRDFFINLPFYTAIGKALAKYWHEVSGVATPGDEPALGPVFFSYGMFLPFLLALAAFVYALARKQYHMLLLVLLAGPTLFYLFDGHISDDHPWLLRRYIFTLFPLVLLLTLWLIQSLAEKISLQRRTLAVSLACSTLFLFQAWPAFQALSVVERRDLLQDTADFSQQFGERDLILIDRLSSGDPYTLLAGPMASLFGTSAVYFFNPEDLGRIEHSGFARIYLLAAEESLHLYLDAFQDSLVPVEVVTFEVDAITPARPFRFPERTTTTQDAILFEVTSL